MQAAVWRLLGAPPPPTAWLVTTVPTHPAAIWQTKLKQTKQLTTSIIYVVAELIFIMFPLLSEEEINPAIYLHTSSQW